LKIREYEQARKLLEEINEKLFYQKQFPPAQVSEKISKKELKAEYRDAVDAFRKKEYQKALILFEKLKYMDSSYNQKKVSRYIEICNQKIKEEEEKQKLEADYNKAVKYFKLALYDQAIELFEKIDKQHPNYKDTSKYLKQANKRKKLLDQLGEYEQVNNSIQP
jgi:tetratricopeptide (TPR) repeat protein